MRLEFPSLAKPEISFTWHTDWDFLRDACRAGRPLSDHCGFFMTYGDGQVQHSHESAVQVHDACDYLASLAAFLALWPDRCEIVAKGWPRQTLQPLDAEFALKVKYRDDKTQWYNLDDRKVSTNDIKRHDKRWTEVVEWHKGNFDSAIAIISTGYLSNLERYAKACELQSYMQLRGLWVSPKAPAARIGAEEFSDELDLTFRAVNHYIGSFRELDMAKRLREAWQHREPVKAADGSPA